MPGKYIGSLTAMRGVAALWVVLFHIDVSLFYRDMGPLLPRDATGLVSKGYLWVDFFFLLSGFVIAHAYAGGLTASQKRCGRLLDYLWARFARIYPLHLLCLGLIVVIALVYPRVVPGVDAAAGDGGADPLGRAGDQDGASMQRFFGELRIDVRIQAHISPKGRFLRHLGLWPDLAVTIAELTRGRKGGKCFIRFARRAK